MSEPVSSIPNLGPAAEASFARAGIGDAETLRKLGADEAYKRLLLSGARPHFIGYYTLVLGLQGRPWKDARATEKKELRKRFNAIKRSVGAATRRRAPDLASLTDDQARLRLEAALDAIGVRAPTA
ncbi:TfoX/Sxy family DNA transformation protein [Rhodovulum sp. DZ06]|uniref:TfoX/Sxy family DNA transformation protein n=1 Tax=Rhodovulum sp. DZ06 TaxID=3425126 RepID=UPI003D325B47